MKYEVKANDTAAVITLHDRSFSTFNAAIAELAEKYQDKKIWMMQSVEKKDQPLRVFIVFEF